MNDVIHKHDNNNVSAVYCKNLVVWVLLKDRRGRGFDSEYVIVLRVLLLSLWISFSTAEKNMIKATWSLAIVCFCFLFLPLIS